MTPILIAMLVILVIAAAVVVYVAFPHRGEQLPAAPWLGDAMTRARDALPTVDPAETERLRLLAAEDRARDRAEEDADTHG